MTQIKRDGRTGIWSAVTDTTTHQAATLAALVELLIVIEGTAQWNSAKRQKKL